MHRKEPQDTATPMVKTSMVPAIEGFHSINLCESPFGLPGGH